jgi:hypothetical protein
VAKREEKLKKSADDYLQLDDVDRSVGGYSAPPLSDNASVSILLITAPRSAPTGYLARVLAELDRQAQVGLSLLYSIQSVFLGPAEETSASSVQCGQQPPGVWCCFSPLPHNTAAPEHHWGE